MSVTICEKCFSKRVDVVNRFENGDEYFIGQNYHRHEWAEITLKCDDCGHKWVEYDPAEYENYRQ